MLPFKRVPKNLVRQLREMSSFRVFLTYYLNDYNSLISPARIHQTQKVVSLIRFQNPFFLL